MTTIPESHLDLVHGPHLQVLVTLMPDGQPHATPVWGGLEEDHLVFTTVRGRRKERNFTRDPRVTVVIIDPDDPQRYLEVRGVVEEVDPERGVDKINEFARLYTDHDTYYGGFAPAERQQQEERILVRVKPTRVNAQT